ncbi:MAG: mechanosensitive ion channel [Candidatus Omnitrophica bacterium]|nr:mechanosensitive ion channel [Candidatus Omnitrophota bacterium]MBU4487777.1 mechanosensitive ion channel [Candidatus Omnitrophota bacterium]MCG2705289.1 mechanosensitive ion channel [Candidatus Omnitrophota bacterium]
MDTRIKNSISGNLVIQLLKRSLLPIFIIVIVGTLYFFHLFKFKAALSVDANRLISKALLIFSVLVITLWVQRISSAFFAWYSAHIAPKTKSNLDDEFMPLLRKLSNICIWIIGLLVILTNLNINIGALIATLGVGSLAIALAAQDTIANVIAGFLIMLDRPFRINDEIKLPSGEKAKVLDIGIRRSRFLSLEDNAIIIVPNLDLSKSKIINFTYGKERREV